MTRRVGRSARGNDWETEVPHHKCSVLRFVAEEGNVQTAG